MLAFRQALRRWLSERAGPRTALLAQWLQGHVHEPEFRLFGWLQDVEGLALDIGAHRGQSAASVLRLAPGLRVHAFEPNPGMTKALNLLRQLHPRRFRWTAAAVGAEPGEAELWIPGSPDSQWAAQASLEHGEFTRPLVRERLSSEGFDSTRTAAFSRHRVQRLRLDDLALDPALIKVDVEGAEAAVLAGLTETLARSRPALLVEVNAPDRWMPALREAGYLSYRFESAPDRLVRSDNLAGVLNLLLLHPSATHPLSTRLRNLAESAVNA